MSAFRAERLSRLLESAGLASAICNRMPARGKYEKMVQPEQIFPELKEFAKKQVEDVDPDDAFLAVRAALSDFAG